MICMFFRTLKNRARCLYPMNIGLRVMDFPQRRRLIA
jgi:hypothetical protein